MEIDSRLKMAYASGYNAATEAAADKVKEAFNALPAGADNVTKDAFLDLYNEIKRTPTIVTQ